MTSSSPAKTTADARPRHAEAAIASDAGPDSQENRDDADRRDRPGKRAYHRNAENIERQVDHAAIEVELRAVPHHRSVLSRRGRQEHKRRKDRERLEIVPPGAIDARPDRPHRGA